MGLDILTYDEWLDLFNLKKITLNTFINTYKIYTTGNIKTLKYTIKEKNLKKNDVKILYKFFIENKEKYLKNFYNKSLKLLNNLQIKNIKLVLHNATNSSYKNLIRNLYYKDILLYTKTEIKNLRPFLEVLFDLFNNKLIDYKLITPSSIKMLHRGLFSNILSGYYFRASILNPTVIYTLSKKYLKGSTVFTPTLGWSSYMYGFLSDNNIKEYVGTDVIKHVCKTTTNLANKLFPNKYIDIYCSPSEQLYKNQKFLDKYSNYFDIVFFSPPYFKLEIYRGKLQSTNLYKTYEEWLDKYWKTTIKLCYKVLKNKGKLVYIISGYDDKIDMNKDMNDITKKYFKYKTYKGLNNTNVEFSKHKDTNEIIYFYTKK